MEVKGLAPKELGDLILSVGTGRRYRRLSPVEVAQYCSKAEISRKELAEILLLSQDQLRFFENLLELPEKYHPLVDWGKTGKNSIGFTSAAVIGGRVKNTDEKGMLIRAAMEYQLTKSDIIHVVQMRNNLGNGMDESIAKVVALKPVEENVFILMGAIKSKKLQDKLSGLTQYQRNIELEKVIRRHVGISDEFGARLGTDSFILILDQEQRDLVTSLGSVEERISESLLEIV